MAGIYGTAGAVRVNCLYWLDERVAGSCAPSAESVGEWVRAGVRTVITLAESWELEHYGRWDPREFRRVLEKSGIKWVHWPTQDGRAPRDLHDLAEIIALEASRGAVVVHCVGGVGRTATALAAYLVLTKCLSADDAIQEVQRANPLISVTDEQYLALLEVEVSARDRCRQARKV